MSSERLSHIDQAAMASIERNDIKQALSDARQAQVLGYPGLERQIKNLEVLNEKLR